MAMETGVGLQTLSTIDTWMAGNWRIWELKAGPAGDGVRVIAGRYLGTDSKITRLMMFDGPVEAGNYIGTWDSRLVGFDARLEPSDRMDDLTVVGS
jgi:hypothetical protein